MRLKVRWEVTDNKMEIIQAMAYDGFAGTHVSHITDVEDHKTFLEIRYVLVGRAVPQTVYLAWRRSAFHRKATWLRVMP